MLFFPITFKPVDVKGENGRNDIFGRLHNLRLQTIATCTKKNRPQRMQAYYSGRGALSLRKDIRRIIPGSARPFREQRNTRWLSAERFRCSIRTPSCKHCTATPSASSATPVPSRTSRVRFPRAEPV